MSAPANVEGQRRKFDPEWRIKVTESLGCLHNLKTLGDGYYYPTPCNGCPPRRLQLHSPHRHDDDLWPGVLDALDSRMPERRLVCRVTGPERNPVVDWYFRDLFTGAITEATPKEVTAVARKALKGFQWIYGDGGTQGWIQWSLSNWAGALRFGLAPLTDISTGAEHQVRRLCDTAVGIPRPDDLARISLVSEDVITRSLPEWAQLPKISPEDYDTYDE